MDLIEIIKILLSAVVGLIIAELWRRLQTGNKRIIYDYRSGYVMLKNASKNTLKESDDVARNDPIRISLSQNNIDYINEELKEDNNNNGFSLSDEGYLHFDYWESNEYLYLFLETAEDELETDNLVSGTLIDGEIIPEIEMKKRKQMFENMILLCLLLPMLYSFILFAFPSLGNNIIVSTYIPLAIWVYDFAIGYLYLLHID